MGDGAIPLLCIVAFLQVLTTVQQLIVLRAQRRTQRPPPPVGHQFEAPPLELEPTLVQRYAKRVRESLHSLRPRPRRKRRTLDDSDSES